jgi:A/G-specific adenine glycosylase
MPWRKTRSAYRILVSEVMLQQTGVDRVTSKYKNFLRAFPGFRSLAGASVKETLAAWKGLGYNRRALALRETARIISKELHGRIPRTVEGLMELPGIGRATASAVLVYRFNVPLPFIETNIRRVFLHFYFPTGRRIKDARIMPLVEKTLDKDNPREWYYALMDYGAMLGKTQENPNRRSAHYKKQAAFAGSLRQLRGRILAALLERGAATALQIGRAIEASDRLRDEAISQLVAEGFLARKGRRYYFR